MSPYEVHDDMEPVESGPMISKPETPEPEAPKQEPEPPGKSDSGVIMSAHNPDDTEPEVPGAAAPKSEQELEPPGKSDSSAHQPDDMQPEAPGAATPKPEPEPPGKSDSGAIMSSDDEGEEIGVFDRIPRRRFSPGSSLRREVIMQHHRGPFMTPFREPYKIPFRQAFMRPYREGATVPMPPKSPPQPPLTVMLDRPAPEDVIVPGTEKKLDVEALVEAHLKHTARLNAYLQVSNRRYDTHMEKIRQMKEAAAAAEAKGEDEDKLAKVEIADLTHQVDLEEAHLKGLVEGVWALDKDPKKHPYRNDRGEEVTVERHMQELDGDLSQRRPATHMSEEEAKAQVKFAYKRAYWYGWAGVPADHKEWDRGPGPWLSDTDADTEDEDDSGIRLEGVSKREGTKYLVQVPKWFVEFEKKGWVWLEHDRAKGRFNELMNMVHALKRTALDMEWLAANRGYKQTTPTLTTMTMAMSKGEEGSSSSKSSKTTLVGERSHGLVSVLDWKMEVNRHKKQQRREAGKKTTTSGHIKEVDVGKPRASPRAVHEYLTGRIEECTRIVGVREREEWGKRVEGKASIPEEDESEE